MVLWLGNSPIDECTEMFYPCPVLLVSRKSTATEGRCSGAKAQLNDLEHPGVPIHQEVLGNQGLGNGESWASSASCPVLPPFVVQP